MTGVGTSRLWRAARWLASRRPARPGSECVVYITDGSGRVWEILQAGGGSILLRAPEDRIAVSVNVSNEIIIRTERL